MEPDAESSHASRLRGDDAIRAAQGIHTHASGRAHWGKDRTRAPKDQDHTVPAWPQLRLRPEGPLHITVQSYSIGNALMVENRTNVRKILVPSQPTYLAWPGYFARLIGADELALMDDVQFVRQGWQHRNHIWDPATGRRMLTIPVKKKGRYDQRIDEVEIAEPGWEQKHLRQLTQAYPKLHLRGEPGIRLQEYYTHTYGWLRDVNEAFIDMVIDLLGIEIKVTRSSSLNVEGKKTERLLDMCEKTGCNVMRLGPGALDYLNLPMIAEAGVELEIVRTAEGAQGLERDVDLSRLSIMDTLLRHGAESRSMLERDYRMEPSVTSAVVEASGQR